MAGVVFLFFFFFGNAVKKSKILRFKSLMTKEKRDNSFYIFKETIVKRYGESLIRYVHPVCRHWLPPSVYANLSRPL